MRFLKLIKNTISFILNYLKSGFQFNQLFDNTLRYIRLFLWHELEVDEFFIFRLWQRDLQINEYSRFIGWKKHIKALVYLNPIEYRCLTENKFIFYTYCKTMNVATPEIYALYNTNISKIKGFPVLRNLDALKGFLNSNKISDLVIKPADGTKGQSVLTLKYGNMDFYDQDDQLLTNNELEKILSGYTYRDSHQTNFMVQQRLKPHESTLRLNDKVPFSYRVLTILNRNGEPEVVEVNGKASRNNVTDNYESGGMVLSVDSNGICQGGIMKAEPNKVFDKHPDNDFVLKNWKVPQYEDVCQLAKEAAAAYYFVKCIAWDIIVSSEGVFVIEGNNPWNVKQQMSNNRGLWQGTFMEESERLFKSGIPRSPWW